MIKLSIGEQPVKELAIPGEAMSGAVIHQAPAWLVGSAAPPSGTAGAIRSAIKAVLPMLISFIHKQAVEQGKYLPAPNFKSPEARANMIAYGIRYLLDNFATVAAQEQFQLEGEIHDGVLYVTGIISTGPVVGEEAAAGCADPVPSLPGGIG